MARKGRVRGPRPTDISKMKEVQVGRKGGLYVVGKRYEEVSREDLGPIHLLSTRERDTTWEGYPAKTRDRIAEIWDGEVVLFLGAEERGRYWLVGYQDMFGYLELGRVIFFDPGEVDGDDNGDA